MQSNCDKQEKKEPLNVGQKVTYIGLDTRLIGNNYTVKSANTLQCGCQVIDIGLEMPFHYLLKCPIHDTVYSIKSNTAYMFSIVFIPF